MFWVNSLYDELILEDSSQVVDTIFDKIWKLECPPKISFFLWLIAHKKLPTRDFLLRRGMDVTANCLFCNDNDSCSHVIPYCSFAWKVWEEVFEKLNWFLFVPDNVVAVLHAINFLHHNKTRTAIRDMIPVAVFWSIWKKRNPRVFTDKRSNEKGVVNKAILFWMRQRWNWNQHCLYCTREQRLFWNSFFKR